MTNTQPTQTELAAPELQIQGIYFDGRSSKDRAAVLRVGAEQVLLVAEADGDTERTESRFGLKQLTLQPPLSGTRRVIKFPGGARFESFDHEAVGALEARLGQNRLYSAVHFLESKWKYTLMALAATVLFVVGFVKFGVPALALQAAKVTPSGVLKSFDEETVKLLKTHKLLGESETSAAQQQKLQEEFKKVVKWAGGGYNYTLLIRDGEPEGAEFTIGANAFALPNGTIVMTDQLIELSKDPKELIGVLAHEVGHVKHRHTLQSIYQALGLAALTTAFTGDLVSASTFAAAVPNTLLKSGYSRNAETQSDQVAADFMMQAYGTTKPLRDILARLETGSSASDEHDVGEDSNNLEVLATHPGTKNRIEHLRKLEQDLKAK